MSELTGAELDLAVALVEGHDQAIIRGRWCFATPDASSPFRPSTRWEQLGPLIDEYDIWFSSDDGNIHYASIAPHMDNAIQEGETKAIAACRAIVASKEEV